MNKPAFTLTNESITVIHQGRSYTVQKGSPNFNNLRSAILEERWNDVPAHLTISKSLEAWGKGLFKIKNGKAFYGEEELPQGISSRITELATAGHDPTTLFRFWERLRKNPSWRSVKQLFDFLQHRDIPLTKDGCFLAYKSVQANYKDHHSNTFDNSPGTIHEMPRNQISDDPREACHEGFHVGAIQYARDFRSESNGRIVVCKVDPADVVCVPYDSSQQKMRVCKYEVIGNHGIDLTSIVFDETEEIQYGTPEAPVMGKEEVKKTVTTPKPGTTTTKTEKKVPKEFEKYNKMNSAELMNLSIDTLRQYAHKGLDIVGASKIPGGKTALVKAIMKVRK